MLTSVAFGREHFLLGFDRVVALIGPDIPSGCFDLSPLSLVRMSSFQLWPPVTTSALATIWVGA
jgi:hypothetical protein